MTDHQTERRCRCTHLIFDHWDDAPSGACMNGWDPNADGPDYVNGCRCQGFKR